MARPKNRTKMEEPQAIDECCGLEEEKPLRKKKETEYPPKLDCYFEPALGRPKKRYVTYAQGAALYHVHYWSFVKMAKIADANYPIRKTSIVDLDILENYMEAHRELYMTWEV